MRIDKVEYSPNMWETSRNLHYHGTICFSDATDFDIHKIESWIDCSKVVESILRICDTSKISCNNPKKVIFNNPATIVIWEDGSKTVVKVQNGDEFNKETGFALCCAKKMFGNKSNFNNIFKKFCGEDT